LHNYKRGLRHQARKGRAIGAWRTQGAVHLLSAPRRGTVGIRMARALVGESVVGARRYRSLSYSCDARASKQSQGTEVDAANSDPRVVVAVVAYHPCQQDRSPSSRSPCCLGKEARTVGWHWVPAPSEVWSHQGAPVAWYRSSNRQSTKKGLRFRRTVFFLLSWAVSTRSDHAPPCHHVSEGTAWVSTVSGSSSGTTEQTAAKVSQL
jgi:hypothetical protein